MKVYTEQLVEIFGVEPRTITNWINSDPPCPHKKEKSRRVFNLNEVIEWKTAREIAKVQRDLPTDFDASKARKMEADARLAEIEVGKAEGQLVPLDVHESLIGEVCERLRAVLINLPANYSLKLEEVGIPAVDAQAILEGIADDLTVALRGVADDVENDDDSIQAAA